MVAIAMWLAPAAGFAQDSLTETDPDTEVGSVRFRFLGPHVFSAEQLATQIVTRGPSFTDRLRRRFEFLGFVQAPTYTLDPIELQRDMARLRRFYARNGFLEARVDYPDSQFRLTRNKIRVIVTVDEGPTVRIGSRTIEAAEPTPPEHEAAWTTLRTESALQPGDRYTEFDRLQLESTVRTFWRDRGFAFADVSASLAIDSSAALVDLSLLTRLGPLARIDSIRVEGGASVAENVVLRELPIAPGDVFSAKKLTAGQRALFELNLFRVALLDLPDQPEDSLVTVRVRLREAKPRYVDVETGYSREDGGTVGAHWRHRNFLGGARQLALSGSVQSGILARPPVGRLAIEQYSSGISIQQPYLGMRDLSGSLGLTATIIDDPNLGKRYRKATVTPSLLYRFLPFRTASVSYSISQAKPLGSTTLGELDLYSQDVLGLSVTAGWLNNYLNPRRGWIFRPGFETAGTLFGQDVAYTKGYFDALAYLPITDRVSLNVSVRAGRLVPRGGSRDQSDPDTELRFDDIRFYAGGASSVRGWGLNALGPQFARADSVFVAASGDVQVDGARFEAMGGLGKVNGTAELLVPAPGFSSAWRVAMFLDFGGISGRLLRDAEGRVRTDGNGEPLFEDSALPGLGDLQYAVGTGLRLQTPVGAVRFDLAYKLNPRGSDLQDPADEVLFNRGLAGRPPTPNRRRFNFHLSIHRAF